MNPKKWGSVFPRGIGCVRNFGLMDENCYLNDLNGCLDMFHQPANLLFDVSPSSNVSCFEAKTLGLGHATPTSKSWMFSKE